MPLLNANDTPQAGLYRGWTQQHHFDNDEGVVVLPLAHADPNQAIVVRVHSPISRRIVKVHTQKGSNPAMVPAFGDLTHPVSGDLTDQLLSSTVDTRLPSPTVDGSGWEWEYTGVAVYHQVVRTPPDGTQPLPLGEYPFDAANPGINNAPSTVADFANPYSVTVSTVYPSVFLCSGFITPSSAAA